MKALVTGDLAVIASYQVPALPDRGTNLVADQAAVYVSGVAANIAWGLRSLGVDTAVCGAVGDDIFGRAILADLNAMGVDCNLVRTLTTSSDVFTILVDAGGERTMVGSRSASVHVSLDARSMVAARPDWCHISGYTLLNPGVAEMFAGLAAILSTAGIPCSVDLEGIAYTGRHLDLTGLTVLCNRDEYAHYFGHARVAALDGSAMEAIVVRAGAEGCYLATEGRVTHVPPFPATVVDCTGAGDAFNAAFIAARLQGVRVLQACVWGNAAGACNVASGGPRAPLSGAGLRAMVDGRLTAAESGDRFDD